MFKVWVGGLGEEGTRLELEVAFEAFGPVKNIWLAKNPPSFAFIEMEVRLCSTTQVNDRNLNLKMSPAQVLGEIQICRIHGTQRTQ